MAPSGRDESSMVRSTDTGTGCAAGIDGALDGDGQQRMAERLALMTGSGVARRRAGRVHDVTEEHDCGECHPQIGPVPGPAPDRLSPHHAGEQTGSGEREHQLHRCWAIGSHRSDFRTSRGESKAVTPKARKATPASRVMDVDDPGELTLETVGGRSEGVIEPPDPFYRRGDGRGNPGLVSSRSLLKQSASATPPRQRQEWVTTSSNKPTGQDAPVSDSRVWEPPMTRGIASGATMRMRGQCDSRNPAVTSPARVPSSVSPLPP